MDAVDEIKAEGKVRPFLDETHIDASQLKCFEHNSVHQFIKTVTHEFSAVCPFSGLPDLATVIIEYYPSAKKAVELKSLKYYMLSFREVGIYQEAVTRRIYEDLKEKLELGMHWARSLRVTTHYHVRGGFYTTCVEGMIEGSPKIQYPENF